MGPQASQGACLAEGSESDLKAKAYFDARNVALTMAPTLFDIGTCNLDLPYRSAPPFHTNS